MKINQPHTKLYFSFFDITPDQTSFVACELCGKMANDIHHINARGMGGTSKKDDVKELMALCREHHHQYGDIKKYLSFLTEAHLAFIRQYKLTPKDYEHEFLPTYSFPLKNK